VVHIVTIPLEI